MNGGLQGDVTPRALVPGASRMGRRWATNPDHGGHERAPEPSAAVLHRRLLIPAAPASAAVPHTVQPGETLWSIAAANNLTTRTVAAFNGLSENAQVVLGSTIQVPTTVEGYAALQQAGLVPAVAAAAARAPPRPRRASAGGRSGAAGRLHRARRATRCPALAAQAGVSVRAMAAMNGLDPDGRAARRAPCSSCRAAPRARRRRARPRRRTTVVPDAAPAPTPQRVTAADVQTVAAAHGVSPSLAAAIAWQESGFNNGDGLRRQRARRDAGDAGHVGLRAAEPRRRPAARPELGDRQRPRRRAVPQAPARRHRRRRDRRDRRLLPGPRRRSATAACSTTRSSTSPTCRRCARASAASRARSVDQGVDPALASSWSVTRGRTSRGRRPRHEHVEVELANQLQALPVGLAVARAEHRGGPFAVAQEDRVAGEQDAVLAGVPQVGGRARRVARRRDHLEVVVEHVAARERRAHGRLLDAGPVGGVHEQRRVRRRPRRTPPHGSG